MVKKQQMPDWLAQLYGELMKPPYFLQQKEKQRPQSGRQHTDEERPAPKQGPQTTSQRADHASHNTHSDVTLVRNDPPAAPKHAPSEREQAPRSSGGNHEEWRGADIPKAVLDQFPFDVERREERSTVLMVQSQGGKRYAVKRTTIPIPQVRFIHRALSFARKQGFNRFNRFLLTRKKGPALMHEGNVYYATEWIDGQSANFASTEHVAQTAYALAQFHEATRGFNTEKYVPASAFDLFGMTQQRNRDLRQMMLKAETKEAKDPFDELFSSLKPHLFEDASQSLQLLQQPECESFLREDQDNAGIGHLDVIPGNCLYTPDHNVYLIDFELSTFAPRALDIAHLLRRSLQLTNWNGDSAYACFLHFNAVRSMSQVEYRIVQALLQFPYRAWRLAHTRYHFYADPAQTEELRAYNQQESRRQSFLSSLSDQIRGLTVDAT